MKIETISIEDYADIRQSLSGLVHSDHGLVDIITGWHPTAGWTLFLVGPSSKVVMASERVGESTENFTSWHGNQSSIDSGLRRASDWRNFPKFNFWSKSL